VLKSITYELLFILSLHNLCSKNVHLSKVTKIFVGEITAQFGRYLIFSGTTVDNPVFRTLGSVHFHYYGFDLEGYSDSSSSSGFEDPT
jgi:hypothetical protein